ncbi:leucine-rich repeat and calponin homology domain-containing protein isoform X1 [Zeugodacus cucurbitae]|uniref:leucine-rich repeat and calponin homology domain-containing protein isoform X1 n=1 Tax=Zeugodacus cucurbitae TaxID=28588 RepID=UPI0023D8F17D|nr:leucine-rich repeat and calponin homology domain-containing protein isoform X1 [Zeugodacus cucurbitae]
MAATAAVYNRLHSTSGSIGGLSASMGSMAHSQLARSLERILEEAHLSGELILTNRKLKDFPKTGTKYNLTDTVMADLSRNRFCELPEEITTFSFLETLLLYHNTIRSIPESVKHLTSLTYLDLRSNQLAALPREICFLPLQVLLVSNNRLASLPDELGRMDRLTDLDASYNQLSTLPARIGELRSLRSLSLRSNHLMYLPRELTCLTLESLDVSNNRIASLPLEIRQMTALVELNLENNPLTSPPASLCIRGLVHVFKFLETQAAKDEKGSRAGGNYDGYTTLRRAPRHAANGSVLESNRVPRQHQHGAESGYSTCDGIDKRWSHDMPNVKTKLDSPARRTPTTPPPSLSSELMDASLTSSSSTIVDESITLTGNNTSVGSGVQVSPMAVAAAVVKPLNATDSPTKRKVEIQVAVQSAPVTPQHQNHALQQQQQHQHLNYAHSNSNSSNGSNNGSNGSSPEQEDAMMEHYQQMAAGQNGKNDDKSNKNLGNVQTYREYKEALKQQRNLEVSSVYKIKNNQKMLYDMSEASNALNSIAGNMSHHDELNGVGSDNGCNEMIRIVNGANNIPQPKSIMKNGGGGGGIGVVATNGGLNMLNGMLNGVNGGGGGGVVVGDASSDYCVVIPKKPVQKVTPSRNTELMSSLATSKQMQTNTAAITAATAEELEKMLLLQQQQQQVVNGDCMGYVKPNSPMKTLNGVGTGGGGTVGVGILANNNKIPTIGGLKSPVSGTNKLGTAKTHRTVTWNHDIPAEKLSFTMRREFDRQREETELMTQLRSIIETRLKMTLPEDIASALTDGVILCHLANYVRPRSVASIHVPSPGVSKLTMARCRRNVDNFLEACRRIGVDEELICSCADIVPPSDDGSNSSNSNNNKNSLNNNEPQQIQNEISQTLPNPSAVLKTVSALIALDYNPHHQNIRNLQQQYELKLKLQRQQEKLKQQQQEEDEVEVEAENNVKQEEQQRSNPQTTFDFQRRCVLTQDGRIGAGAFEHEYEHQLTATCTKEQMMQPTLHTLGLDNSTFNLSAKCHFDVTVLTNGHGVGVGVASGRGGSVGVDDYEKVNAKDFDSDDIDEGVGAEEEERDEFDAPSNGDPYAQSHAHKQKSQRSNNHNVADFFRHAKLKTFQKIKFNLLSSSGATSCINYGHVNNSQCMLQTIVETESEVIGGATESSSKGSNNNNSGGGGGSGAYQLINEKPTFNEELKLKVESRAIDGAGNKYKLYDLATLQQKTPTVEVEEALPIVSKRIEFFEHSSAGKTNSNSLNNSLNGSLNSSTKSKSPNAATTTATASAAATKSSTNSIFSIYRVVDVNDEKLVINSGKLLNESNATGGLATAEKEVGTSYLLKHDSHVLTIILSCVFIVTFLLLVFFPLPG